MTSPHPWGLTPRERDVAVALATTGGTNKEIARAIGMSPGTVKIHMGRIMAKCGVRSRLQLVILMRTLNPIPDRRRRTDREIKERAA